MRPIKDFEARLDAELDAAWKLRAQNAKTQIEAMPNGDKPDSARSTAINAKSQIWADTKPALRRLSHDKCWYCECLEVRSDSAVDHHRPKNEVRNFDTNTVLDHPGYWWLAFEATNYRFSCQFCNENRKDPATEINGGKLSYFPVYDESERVKTPSGDLGLENPLLLDPVQPADTRLLDFDRQGNVLPRYTEQKNSFFYLRADLSIKIYHLKHSRLVKAREKVADKVARKVEEANRMFVRYASNPANATAKDAVESAFRELKGYIAPSEQFSMQAICVLRTFRSYEWVDDLLES